jgi:hypothetical protein
MRKLWVIECRKLDGTLDFSGAQPESIFGRASITGITDDSMAHIIYRTLPDLAEGVMCGDNIANWPKLIDPRWTAREKTW